MANVNLLYDVQPTVLTLCKAGANRKRIFLKKELGEGKAEVELASRADVIRKADGDDWSYFYCVVAEPGSLEDPGVGDGFGSGVDDMWRDADEIRKAAHFFATSPQLVTGLHDTIEPFGAVVENAIAQSDFDVLDPDGNAQTIRKDSWYVGIRPSDEGKTKIDSGEFTGLSLEGSGYRELVELQKEAAEDEKRSLLRKVADALGITFDAPDDIKKADSTFTELLTADQVDDAFENAVCVLRRVMWNVTAPDFEGDRTATVATSVQQFADYIGSLVTAVSDTSAQALAKELGTLEPEPEEDDQVADTNTSEATLEEIRKEQSATSTAITKLAGLTETLVNHITAKPADEGEGEGGKASAADLKKSIEDLTDAVNSKLDELEVGVNALADQGSTQQTDPDALRKQRETHPLAGILD